MGHGRLACTTHVFFHHWVEHFSFTVYFTSHDVFSSTVVVIISAILYKCVFAFYAFMQKCVLLQFTLTRSVTYTLYFCILWEKVSPSGVLFLMSIKFCFTEYSFNIFIFSSESITGILEYYIAVKISHIYSEITNEKWFQIWYQIFRSVSNN